MAPIIFYGTTFDPAKPDKPIVPLKDASATARFVVIQTKRKLTYADKQALKQKGVELRETVDDVTFLAYRAPNTSTNLSEFDFIAFAFVYPSYFKMSPDVYQLPGSANAQTTDMTFSLTLHTDAAKELSEVAKKLADSPISAKVIDSADRIIFAQVKVARLFDIANIEAVQTIEGSLETKLSLNVARNILEVLQYQEGAKVGGHRYYGSGQVIAVADTGLGNTGVDQQPANSGYYPSFNDRIIDWTDYNIPCKDMQNHGTAMAACISSNPVIIKNSRTGLSSFTLQGVAPEAKLHVIGFDWKTDNSIKFNGLFSVGYKDKEAGGALKFAPILNNSWTSRTRGGTGRNVQAQYEQSSSTVIDAAAYKYRNRLYCFAAGNETLRGASIGGSAASKNSVVVGATCNERAAQPVLDKNFDFQYGIIRDPGDVADFSQKGPLYDGRLKPDVMAPGTCIIAPRSLEKQRDRGGLLPGSTVQITLWDLPGEPRFEVIAGTSPATALVSGCAALLREACIKARFILNPTSALLKALLINGTVDLAGKRVGREMENIVIPPAPNGLQGYGRVNLKNSMRPIHAANPSIGGVLDDINQLLAGTPNANPYRDTWNLTEASDIWVTMCWLDPAGEKVQIRFDMTLTQGTTTKEPNPYQEWRNQAGNGPATEGNAMRPREVPNNVNKIVWLNCPPGNVNLQIQCGQAFQHETSAKFSLVWSIVPVSHRPDPAEIQRIDARRDQENNLRKASNKVFDEDPRRREDGKSPETPSVEYSTNENDIRSANESDTRNGRVRPNN